MPAVQGTLILDSVVRITEQRNREDLERCLVETLIDLTDLSRVSIVSVKPAGGAPVAECLACIGADGNRCARCEPRPLPEFPLVERAVASGLEEVEVGQNGGFAAAVPAYGGGPDDPQSFLVVEGTGDSAHHRKLVHGFAAIYRNFTGVLRDAERDTLTGLKNRRTFDENIGRIVGAAAGARRGDTTERRHHADAELHWLAICDIDHFKRINDTYGHIFGDEVLLLFAAIMRKTFRAEDLLFRYGGEEFLAVLAPTSAERAAQAFERFRAAIEAFAFPPVGRVAVCVGDVPILADDVSSEVLGRADTALYYVKSHGRNGVRSFDELVAQGLLIRPSEVGSVDLFESA